MGVSVIRSREASTVSVAELVRNEVAEINKTLPEGTQLEVTRTVARMPPARCDNVVEALIFGAVLTIFVVYVFLNSWRSTLITSLSLPTSVIAAFIAVWAAGFTLNFMTLLGLSLAIGVLIDDAIVVRENIVRHMERGDDRVTAARNGTAEIGLAVTATTFSIVAVFVPVAFMGGGAGEWFRPFGVTVVSFGAGQPAHLVHARPDAVGLLGRSARLCPQRAPRPRQVSAAVQSVVRSPGRPLRQGHRLGPASPQVDGRDCSAYAWHWPWRCKPPSAGANSCRSRTTA